MGGTARPTWNGPKAPRITGSWKHLRHWHGNGFELPNWAHCLARPRFPVGFEIRRIWANEVRYQEASRLNEALALASPSHIALACADLHHPAAAHHMVL